MFNLKDVHQFEYCAIKKTQNTSAVSQKEFRSSTCDSTLKSTWRRLCLDSDTVNMRRLLANHKLEFSIPYCASAVYIYLESPIFAISLPPLSSSLCSPATTEERLPAAVQIAHLNFRTLRQRSRQTGLVRSPGESGWLCTH